MLSSLPSHLVGRSVLWVGLWVVVWMGGSLAVAVANEPSRSAPYPPLRNAMQRASWLGNTPGKELAPSAPSSVDGATSGSSSSASVSATASSPASSGATGVAGAATVADARWCGIESPTSQPEQTAPCKLTTLPCGPVSADRIFNNSGEETDDLDGDGLRDLVVGGRLSVQSKDVFAAVYRGSEGGFLLTDFRVVPPRAEPTFASVLLTENGKPPVLRDGHDLVESNGRSYSVARLRRFDGQRFRTLLTFCAHRSEPSTGLPGGVRQGLNRVDFIDVDKDGSKEVVIQGLLAPTVFRFADGGLMLMEDRSLTRTFRELGPEAVRAKMLRDEAEKLLDAGEVRRAAELYQRAYLSMPYDIELGLAAAEAQVRGGLTERALEMLTRLRFQDPERGSTACTLAATYRAMKNPVGELPALRACVEKETDEARRRPAMNRLRELSGLSPLPTAPAGSMISPSQQAIVDDALSNP